MRETGDGLFLGTLASYCCCLHADDTRDFADTFFMPSVQGLEQRCIGRVLVIVMAERASDADIETKGSPPSTL